jgi:predicted DNA-binding transcriptional regulator
VLVDKLLKPFSAERRLEVAELEIGEVARELVEAGLVRLVRVRQQPTTVLAEIRASVLAEREGPVGLVFHSLALNAGRELEQL